MPNKPEHAGATAAAARQDRTERGKVLPFATPSRRPTVRAEDTDTRLSLPLQAQPSQHVIRSRHELTMQRAERRDLLDELLEEAGSRTREILAMPDAAARLRQLGSDDLSEIQRLETSPLAIDQLVAVGLRLAGSRTLRSDVADHLRSYFGSPSSSLEIEAQRRSIWKVNRTEAIPTAEAEAASRTIEKQIRERGFELGDELPRWAALYADLWCDPRLGASARARRVMLAMVTLMHERSQALAQTTLSGSASAR